MTTTWVLDDISNFSFYLLLFYHLQSILYNSTKTKDFTRLYLDVTTITGSYCHLAGNGEDDISLSSVDEDDNDSVSEDYTEENKKNNQNDISAIAQQSADVEHGEEVVVDLTSSPSSGRQQQQKSSVCIYDAAVEACVED